jgi:predicted DNA-binding transcriptional regulator AlpA
MADVPRLLVNVREAARMLGVSERTLWAISRPRGTLPTIRVGRRTLYAIKDLESWIDMKKGVDRVSPRTADAP